MRRAQTHRLRDLANYPTNERKTATPLARAGLLLAGALLAACTDRAVESTAPEQPDAPPLQAETSDGPVRATVSLSPSAPRLGDALVLMLVVEAEAGVSVEMPAFGDALGRFAIVDFTPREEVADDGALRMSQRYTLQVPMSGRQRIPRLRIEYLDQRAGQAPAKPRELLTDELGFTVESVLPEGAIGDELRPARQPLPELAGPWRHWPWLALALLAVAALTVAAVFWRRHAEQRARVTAYDRAMARLEALSRQGVPDAAHLDAWYVELSDIVRRYIEARFGLRAPELTTEEFLLEAGRSADLSPDRRGKLSTFLASCDRVKFARYSPGEGESLGALDLARQFLNETRHDADRATPPSPNAASTAAQTA